jgi:hypothetical protein
MRQTLPLLLADQEQAKMIIIAQLHLSTTLWRKIGKNVAKGFGPVAGFH